MMFSRAEVLKRIRPLAESEDYEAARSLLSSPKAQPYDPPVRKTDAEPRVVRPSDIIGTWKARLQNARKQGKKLYGCADFVRNLDQLSDTADLVTCSFKDSHSTGLFWFEAASDRPIGFVIVGSPADS